jgi:hypothetical protein
MNAPKSKAEIKRIKKANQKFLDGAQSTAEPATRIQVIQFRFADGTTMSMSRAEHETRLAEQRAKFAEYGDVARAAVTHARWEDSQDRSDRAKDGHANSGKGKAKIAVEAEWKKWREAKGKGRWRAAFARKMLDLHPVLENQKSIENWAKDWEDEYAKIEK